MWSLKKNTYLNTKISNTHLRTVDMYRQSKKKQIEKISKIQTKQKCLLLKECLEVRTIYKIISI